MRPDLEEAFIRKFVLKHKRPRYLYFLERGEATGFIASTLHHGQDIDYGLFREMRAYDRAFVLQKAAELKLKSGYIVSDDSRINGLKMPSEAAINTAFGQEATLLILGNNQLVYFETEHPSPGYLSL